jgi:hypothetical protein
MFVYQRIVRKRNPKNLLSTHFVSLNVREAVVERVEEIHEPPQKPRELDGLFHALWVEQRALNEILKRLEVPLVVILRQRNL